MAAAAITRYAALHDRLRDGRYFQPEIRVRIDASVEDGVLRAAEQTRFTTAYFHDPDDLVGEFHDAGLVDVRRLGLEGAAWLSGDLASWLDDAQASRHPARGDAVMAGIQLRSLAFDDHSFIPGRHAHDGKNLSPTLEWSGVPDGTAELLLLCEDPDAPAGTFLHWLVTGIDPAASGVGEGQTRPGGQHWANGFGEDGWGGPQPPRGDNPHRYFFRLYSLPEPVRLPAKPTADDVHRAVDDAALASGTTVGLYQR